MVDAISSRDATAARRKAAEHINKAIKRSASLVMGAIRFGEAVFEAAPKCDRYSFRFSSDA